MDRACSTHEREMRNAYNILVGKLKGKRHSEGPVIDGKMLLEFMSRR